VPTTLSAGARDLERWRELRLPEAFAAGCRRMEQAYLSMGTVPAWTCAPYLHAAALRVGDQVAWAESNAIVYANTVIGARTARYGDAWFPIGCNPRFPLDTIGRFSASLDDLRAMAEAEGRDPAEIDLAFWAVWYGANQEPIMTDTGERMLLSGSADDIAGDIQALRELGCRHLMLQFLRESIGETLDAITEFAEEVRPKADG
jgi:hypothetical protein